MKFCEKIWLFKKNCLHLPVLQLLFSFEKVFLKKNL